MSSQRYSKQTNQPRTPHWSPFDYTREPTILLFGKINKDLSCPYCMRSIKTVSQGNQIIGEKKFPFRKKLLLINREGMIELKHSHLQPLNNDSSNHHQCLLRIPTNPTPSMKYSCQEKTKSNLLWSSLFTGNTRDKGTCEITPLRHKKQNMDCTGNAETFPKGPRSQNYFHENINTLFAFFTVLILTLMVQSNSG